MKTKNISEMIALLEKKGIQVCGTTDDFYGYKGDSQGIWMSGESDKAVFNYYKKNWYRGIEPKLNAIVDKYGWAFEWQDAGTIMLWQK